MAAVVLVGCDCAELSVDVGGCCVALGEPPPRVTVGPSSTFCEDCPSLADCVVAEAEFGSAVTVRVSVGTLVV